MAAQGGGFPAVARLLREAVAIFIGVAAALAGQAWFEGRTERAAEREFLSGTLEELVNLEGVVGVILSSADQRRLELIELADLLAAPPDPTAGDSILYLATRLARRDNYFDNIDALLDPANLSLVQDPELRERLVAFRTRAGHLTAVLDQNTDFILGEWRAVGIENFDYRVDGGAWRAETVRPPVSRHMRDGLRLASSVEFENLVDLYITQMRNILDRASAVKEDIEEVRALVRERLAAL